MSAVNTGQQAPPGLPAGGAIGQFLTKTGAADGAVGWATPVGVSFTTWPVAGSFYDNRWPLWSPASATVGPPAGTLYLPFYLPAPIAPSALFAFAVGAATTNVWTSLFTAGATGLPTTMLTSTGNTAGSGVSVGGTIASIGTLQPGMYYFGLGGDGGNLFAAVDPTRMWSPMRANSTGPNMNSGYTCWFDAATTGQPASNPAVTLYDIVSGFGYVPVVWVKG